MSENVRRLKPVLQRRDFLKQSSLIALAPSLPAFLANSARAAEPGHDERVLVVVQLDGGNDGINTVVPFGDEGYAKHRRALRIAPERLIKIDEGVGLNPALRGAADLLETRQLAIVQGVGYPNPNRSHEVSMRIWQSARFDPEEHKSFGWIGRAADELPRPNSGAPSSLLVGEEAPPLAIRGRKSAAVVLASLDDFDADFSVGGRPGPMNDSNGLAGFIQRTNLDARIVAGRLHDLARQDAASEKYPATRLAGRLRLIARLIKADFGTRIYYAVQSGYDTHAAQLPTHGNLLGELGGALRAFLDDMNAAGLADRVLVVCFSEFGRRVEENASQGTDHGTAGPVILAGPGVKAGLFGATPSLVDLEGGDLKMSVDFRAVYATLLEQWLGVASSDAVGGRFEALALLRS
jgi:uncharacterized protein (DUF1501 family)